MSSEPSLTSGPRQLNLSELTVHQLTQLKQQFDQELSIFQDALHNLKMAQGKFTDSFESLEQLRPTDVNKGILVPLTQSIYVPGVIRNVDTFLIDIGTGYYARMGLDQTKDYFQRKVTYVCEQMEKIHTLGLEKATIRETICDVIEAKFKAEQLKKQTDTTQQ